MPKRKDATVTTPKHSRKAFGHTPQKSRKAAAVVKAAAVKPPVEADALPSKRRRRRSAVVTSVFSQCSEESTEIYDGEAAAAAFALGDKSVSSDSVQVDYGPWGGTDEDTDDDDAAVDAYIRCMGWVLT